MLYLPPPPLHPPLPIGRRFKQVAKKQRILHLKVQVSQGNARMSATKQTRKPSSPCSLESCHFFLPSEDGGVFAHGASRASSGLEKCPSRGREFSPGWVHFNSHCVSSDAAGYIFNRQMANFTVLSQSLAGKHPESPWYGKAQQKVQQDTWGKHKLTSALLLQRL